MPLVNLPSASDMLASVGTSSAPVFTALLPLALFGAGIIIGGLIVYAIMSWLIGGISNIMEGRNAYKKYNEDGR